MKNIFLAFSISLSTVIQAQSFSAGGGQIANTGNPTNFPVSVTGLQNSGNSFGVMQVAVDITHPEMNEINIGLRSPTGQYVELVNNTGIKGANFINTILSYTASLPITAGTAPYSGSYKPIGYFGRFNNGSPCNGTWYLSVKDYNPNGNAGSLNSWTISFGSGAPAALNFTSSNLPIITINTNGQGISTNTIVVDFGIIDNGGSRNNVTDPKNGFNGKAKLNIRGSSSQIYEKKSYKIDLCDASGNVPVNAPLLGMPPESDWVLTSGFSDKSLMRNALTSMLFAKITHYSPRTRHVEVIINGEYAGVYTFTEKIKRNSQRVNVDKMMSLDNNFPFVTGGYIIQVNRSDDQGWWSSLPGISGNGAKFYYQYVYPRAEDITVSQKNYIQAFMDTVEKVINGPDCFDPVKGYKKYIDPVSFADLLIINEFSKNIDGYRLSTYLYKDNILEGGKLHAGPVWDYDIAWKNSLIGNANQEQWWQYDHPTDFEPLPTWWLKLMQDNDFKNLVWCRWQTFRRDAYSTNTINGWIDQTAQLLQESQQRNFTQFPILDQYIYPNPPSEISNNYNNIVADLKDWIQKRGAWLDQNLPGFCNNVGVQTFASSGTFFTSFPNPFSGSLTVGTEQLPEGEYLLSVTNLLGETIMSVPHLPVGTGSAAFQINTEDWTAGTYILEISGNNQSHYAKIIKTAF